MSTKEMFFEPSTISSSSVKKLYLESSSSTCLSKGTFIRSGDKINSLIYFIATRIRSLLLLKVFTTITASLDGVKVTPMDMTYWIKAVLRMFYIVTPSEYKTENGSSACKERHFVIPTIGNLNLPPNKCNDEITVAFFALFIILENVILYSRKGSFSRLNDNINSLSHGIFFACGKLLSRGLENWLYCYIYSNFRLIELQWDSVVTWYSVAIMVDFCYYWVHRASHEIHILWAQHQVHHSSEDFNLAVGLRQSIFHSWCGFILYLPMAFFVPPTKFIVHQEFNLLYQFWIHTEVVTHLGPLEYVLNTPNHHRVHHGSNLMYLDKNYGGVLIIWDRIFGTFTPFVSEIIYGLVYQPRTFNPLYQQFFYNANVYTKFKSYEDWPNKVQAVIKGPSWTPGSKWTGDEENKPNIQRRPKYNPPLKTWRKIYLSLHFVLTLKQFDDIAAQSDLIGPIQTFTLLCYILLSLTVIGMFFDNNPNAITMEIIRCLVVYVWIRFSGKDLYFLNFDVEIIYILSGCFWMFYLYKLLYFYGNNNKKSTY